MLEESRRLFGLLPDINRRQAYQLVKTYRLLGDEYYKEHENLLAEQCFSEGLGVFENQKSLNGLESNSDVGAMFAALGNIYYFIDYSMDDALYNYQQAVINHHDTPSLRYRIGYINYGKGSYANALGSFIKTVNEAPGDYNALLALANTLALQNNNYAAEGYYTDLIERINAERGIEGMILPQVRDEHAVLVESYLKAANNLGVALYRQSLSAERNSKIAQSIIWLSESVRAWDALNRNQVTMNRVEGSNLAQENIRYITSPALNYTPEIYTVIPRTLMRETAEN
jgi:tetratricopeptide (TPR) repeat protein